MYIYLYGMTRGQDGTSLSTTYCVYKGNTFWLYALLPLGGGSTSNDLKNMGINNICMSQ